MQRYKQVREAEADAAEPSGSPASAAQRGWSAARRLLRERSGLLAFAAIAAMALVLAYVLWDSSRTEVEEAAHVDVQAEIEEALGEQSQEPAVSALVYRAILPSLVVVQADVGGEEDGVGIGAGVVINRDAEVLTAWHVVEHSPEVSVAFSDGTLTTAVVANVDEARGHRGVDARWVAGPRDAGDDRQPFVAERRRRDIRCRQPAGAGGVAERGAWCRASTGSTCRRTGTCRSAA